MEHFIIISSQTGDVIFEGTPKYVGTYLKPGYLEFSEIASDAPIDWHIGDYVPYSRTGTTYRLYKTPKQAKQATAQRHGSAFLYENVQFFDITKDLEAPFIDLVQGDNLTHFSTFNTVAFTGDVSDLAERLEACMNYWYPDSVNRWEFRIIGGLDSVEDAELIETINTEVNFNVSGATCQEALEKMYDTWNGLGWSYSDENGVRVITIGAPNKRTSANTTVAFSYGNGLTRLGKSVSNADEIGTRLYAYGSTKNTFGDYYRSKDILNAESVDISHLMLPINAVSSLGYDGWGTTDGKPDARKAYIEALQETINKLGLIPRYAYFDGTDEKYPEIFPSIEGTTIGDLRAAMGSSSSQYYPSASKWSDTQRLDEVVSASNPTDAGAETSGGSSYNEKDTVSLYPYGRTIQIPENSSAEIVVFTSNVARLENIDGDSSVHLTFNLSGSISDGTLNYVVLSIHRQSSLTGDAAIDQIAVDYGIDSFPFPETIEIDDTIQDGESVSYWVEVTVGPEAGEARTFTVDFDGGTISFYTKNVFSDTFTIVIPQIGFNIEDRAELGDGMTISMKSGMCAGRDFKIKGCEYLPSSDSWRLTLYRSKDNDLGLLFPYNDYGIAPGDKFVILDIAMPDIYTEMASIRLLKAAQKLLADIDHEKPFYEPEIDAKVVYNQSLTIREGMYMHLVADEIVDGGEDYVMIDSFEIDEGGSNIPTYTVKLRQKKAVEWTENVSRGENSKNTTSASSDGNKNYLTKKQADALYMAKGSAGAGTVTGIKIGNSSFVPVNGIVNLQALTIAGQIYDGSTALSIESVKNPYALTFGSKTYDGSSAATITASDIGALTSSNIKTLTLNSGSFSGGTFNPVGNSNTTFTVPSALTHLSDWSTLDSRIAALESMWEIDSNGYLHAKNNKSVWTEGFISAGGLSDEEGGSIVAALKDLTDVSNSLNPSAGQVLTYRNGEWNAETPQSGVSSISLTGEVTGSGTGTIVTSISTGAISTAKLADLAVTAAKLAADSVTTAKIADGNVTLAKLAADAKSMTLWGQTATLGSTVTGDMSSVGKITFTAKSSETNTGNVLEVVTANGLTYLHSHLPIVSDDFISAGGLSDTSGGGTGSSTLAGLTDTTITNPDNGQFLKYNGSSWVNSSIALANIDGFSMATLATGQVLRFNGQNWTNQMLSLGSLSGVDITNADEDFILKYDANGNWTAVANTLGGLSDVDTSGVVNGNSLVYQNGTWVPGAGGGGKALAGLTDDVDVVSTPPQGTQVLTYSAADSKWIPANIQQGSVTGGTIFYGIIATAGIAATAKAITCAEFTSSDLKKGTYLVLLCNRSNSATSGITFDVNGTGAKSVMMEGSVSSTQAWAPNKEFDYQYAQGEVLTFVYSGTVWVFTSPKIDKIAAAQTYGMVRMMPDPSSSSMVGAYLHDYASISGMTISVNTAYMLYQVASASAGSTLYGLTDTSIRENPSAGSVLAYYNGYWNDELFRLDASSMSSASDGNVLVYDETFGVWKPGSGGSGGGSYTLPTATASRLGGIMVGTGLSITSSGVLSVTGGGSGGTEYSSGTGITVDNDDYIISLDMASTSYIGGVKPASTSSSAITHTIASSGTYYGITMDRNGKLVVRIPSSSGGGGTTYSAGDGIDITDDVISLDLYKRSSSVTTESRTSTSGRYYEVEMDSDGKVFVNVPWAGGGSGSSGVTSVAGLTGDITASQLLSALSLSDTISRDDLTNALSSYVTTSAMNTALNGYLPLTAGTSKPLTGTLVGRDFRPSSTETYDLGTSSYFWNNIYVKRIYLANGVYIDYDTDGYIYINGNLVASGYISAGGVSTT